MGIEVVIFAIKLFLVFNIIMGLASFCTWVERKGSALIQDRVGANRAGAYFDFNLDIVRSFPSFLRPLGAPVTYALLLPVVTGIKIAGQLGIINTLLNDAVKALFKEDFVPDGVSNFMHSLAPFLAVLPVFVAFSILPFAPEFTVLGTVVRPQLAPIDVGILFFLAMGSVAVYGVALAGWTGNNKYSLLGALRASAQMISYELAMGISVVTIIIFYGTPDLFKIVELQEGSILQWGVFRNIGTGLIAMIAFFIAGMAETKRAPFDLPESESELVAGYFTEYSGMKFLIFWLGEFAEIALFSFVMVLLFFGGWHIPFVHLPAGVWWAALIGHGVLMAKVLFFCVLQIVIRWTLPRFRYDQLMNLGWKFLLPLSMVNLVIAAAWELSK
jgi:NADH-quinone oxidoreductase subunit H